MLYVLACCIYSYDKMQWLIIMLLYISVYILCILIMAWLWFALAYVHLNVSMYKEMIRTNIRATLQSLSSLLLILSTLYLQVNSLFDTLWHTL